MTSDNLDMEDLISTLKSPSNECGAQVCTMVSDSSQNATFLSRNKCTTSSATSGTTTDSSNKTGNGLTTNNNIIPSAVRQRRNKHEVFESIYSEVSLLISINHHKNVSQLLRL